MLPQSQDVIQSGIKILVIGPAGVGKTKLFHQINNTYRKRGQLNAKDQPFQEIDLIPNYQFVDTPTTDLDSKIETREKTIQLFQEYFLKNGHLISTFFIAVNFERTDLMKEKVKYVFKYFRKFENKIGIIVTDFQLSENPENDKQNLITAFEIYAIPDKRILFISNSMSSEEVKQQIISAVDVFNLDKTMFEVQSQEDQEIQQREFAEHMNKIMPH